MPFVRLECTTLATGRGLRPLAAVQRLLLRRLTQIPFSAVASTACKAQPRLASSTAVYRASSRTGWERSSACQQLRFQTWPALRASQQETPGDPTLELIDDSQADLGEVDDTGADEDGEGDDEEYYDEEDDDEDEGETWEAETSTSLDTAGTAWGASGLKLAQDILEHPTMHGLALYGFQAVARNKRMVISLDKLDDQYGSPSFEDIQAFHKVFVPRLADDVGQQLADQIELEISSPGAERAVKLPLELTRFQHLPMRVCWSAPTDGAQQPASQPEPQILALVSYDAEAENTTWKLADVKVNRGKTGRLSKRKQQQQFLIHIKDMESVNLYLDV